MRINAVLNIQFDIPDAVDNDEDAAVEAVCAALGELDLIDLIELEIPEFNDREASFTINLDGSPSNQDYDE